MRSVPGSKTLGICLAGLVILIGQVSACSNRPATSENASSPAANVPVSSSSDEQAGSVSAAGTQPQAQAPVDKPVEDKIALLLNAEDYDSAVTTARAELGASASPSESLKEKLADAYIARAWFYKTKRLTTYTLTDLFKAVEAAPDYYRAHYELGRFHNNQWQFSIGLVDLNKAISLKPDFAPAYSERAYSYYKNQKFELALADVNKAIAIDPSDPRSLCNRSLIYVAMGKTGLALQDADKAVQLSPSDAPSYYNRGLVYEAIDKPDLAIADFKTTVGFSDDDLLTTRAGAELQKLQK
jgi:tetratricopeptide (TPR) repeat protein